MDREHAKKGDRIGQGAAAAFQAGADESNQNEACMAQQLVGSLGNTPQESTASKGETRKIKDGFMSPMKH